MTARELNTEAALRWFDAEECKDVVLRFMALFDQRAYDAMEVCVLPQIEWQRPDQTLRGLAQMRDALLRAPQDVRVRHVITNLRASFAGDGRVTIDSYFTVYRCLGAIECEPARLVGPVSVGRYCDELVKADGAWKIVRKQTFSDFRRA